MQQTLLVDDNPTGTGLLVALLRFAGYRIFHWRIGRNRPPTWSKGTGKRFNAESPFRTIQEIMEVSL